jgi:SAM-dependent methyltransferase
VIYDDDPALYDLQYAAYRDDIPFYLRLADELGGPVLELGAGTGRVTEALARAGHQVVAVDVSAAMLGRAEERLGDLDGLEFVLADMRSLDLGREFPLVLAPFNTLMHAYLVADQDRVLAAVRGHLAAGGTFAFDVFQPHLGPLGVMRREPTWAELGAGAELFLVQHHDPEAQLVESLYYLDERRPDGTLRRRQARLVQRYFNRYELERALAQAGFGTVRLFGGFDKSRLLASSPMIVALARP